MIILQLEWFWSHSSRTSRRRRKATEGSITWFVNNWTNRSAIKDFVVEIPILPHICIRTDCPAPKYPRRAELNPVTISVIRRRRGSGTSRSDSSTTRSLAIQSIWRNSHMHHWSLTLSPNCTTRPLTDPFRLPKLQNQTRPICKVDFIGKKLRAGKGQWKRVDVEGWNSYFAITLSDQFELHWESRIGLLTSYSPIASDFFFYGF